MKTTMTTLPRSLPAIRLISILFVTFTLGEIAAQERAYAPNASSVDNVEQTTANGPEPIPVPVTDPVVDPDKQIKVAILLSAVGGIAVFGIGAIAVTMLWARRLRRIARDPGPPQTTVGNDFWFLKPPKPIVSESDTTDSRRSPHTPPETETPE